MSERVGVLREICVNEKIFKIFCVYRLTIILRGCIIFIVR